MEKIIVLVDFSKEAKNTIDYGIQFALEYDKEIEFLNTSLYSEIFLSYTNESKQEMEYRHFEKAKESFNMILHDLTQRYHELPDIDIEIQYGMHTELIKKILEEKHAQLIITSAHQKKNEIQFITSENKIFIENSNCPVMIIPPETSFKSYKHMIYATDYNQDEMLMSRYFINKISTLQSLTFGIHATYSAVGFHLKNENKFKNLICQNINYDHLQIDTSMQDEIAQTICEYASLKKADIIAISAENTEVMKSFESFNNVEQPDEERFPLVVFQIN